MNIYGKALFEDRNQICDRTINKKNKNIEVQLLKDINYLTDKEICNILSVSMANIDCVHSLLKLNDATTLYHFLDAENNYIERIINGLEFTERLRKFQRKQRMYFIIHSHMSKSIFDLSCKNNLFIQRLSEVLELYPNIYFLIENGTVPDGIINGTGGNLFEPTEICKHLNLLFETNRFKSLLDTCHMISTIRCYKEILNQTYTMEDYFKEYKDTVGWIHLSNCKGYGFEQKDHGLPFDDKSVDELKEIIDLYFKYNYNCSISLEVNEINYNDAKNYELTMKTLKNLLKNM